MQVSLREGATQPPPRLFERDLIAAMERHGIGTDATVAGQALRPDSKTPEQLPHELDVRGGFHSRQQDAKPTTWRCTNDMCPPWLPVTVLQSTSRSSWSAAMLSRTTPRRPSRPRPWGSP